MSVEILSQIPLSGDYPEKYFGQHFNSQLWVKFMDNNFQEWVGCFPQLYHLTLNKVLTDNANETAFVIAGGQGYLINIETRELLYETVDIPVLESAIHTENPEYFLVGACFCIHIFDNKSYLETYTPNFTVDGIYFTEQKGQKAIGHLYSYEYQQDLNVGFEFDIETKKMTIDKNVRVRQLGPFEFVTVTEKKIKANESFFTKILKRLTDK